MSRDSIRVTMIGPSLASRGGMATVERQLVDLIPKGEISVSFIPTYNDGGKFKKAAYAAVAYFRFARALKSSDLVHVHMAAHASFWRKKLFINAACRYGVPVILHLHASEFAKWFNDECDDEQRGTVRSIFQRCSAVIALSEEWRDYLLANNICEANRLHVLHNAVSVPAQPCSPGLYRDILFLGRLDERKSPDVLLRAAKAMLGEYHDAKLLFGGDGHPERYEALAHELGIADRCEFLGWITGEDKEKLFGRVGVYCLPSKREGMPMSVLEAMAHGIPTVATPVGGVPQVINDGIDGFIMPVDDEEKLSAILLRLAGSPELRERVGLAARNRVASEFNIDKNIEALTNLYKAVLLAATDGMAS